MSTGVTHALEGPPSGWSSRTAPRQAPAATAASACPWSVHCASSSFCWIACLIPASPVFHSSSARHTAAAFLSSSASLASARRFFVTALLTARSVCQTARCPRISSSRSSANSICAVYGTPPPSRYWARAIRPRSAFSTAICFRSRPSSSSNRFAFVFCATAARRPASYRCVATAASSNNRATWALVPASSDAPRAPPPSLSAAVGRATRTAEAHSSTTTNSGCRREKRMSAIVARSSATVLFESYSWGTQCPGRSKGAGPNRNLTAACSARRLVGGAGPY